PTIRLQQQLQFTQCGDDTLSPFRRSLGNVPQSPDTIRQSGSLSIDQSSGLFFPEVISSRVEISQSGANQITQPELELIDSLLNAAFATLCPLLSGDLIDRLFW